MRLVRLLALAAPLLAATGCVAVSAKGNRFGSDREAVAANGRIYVVDKRCRVAYEVRVAGPDEHCPEQPESAERQP